MKEININMRCIEIDKLPGKAICRKLININMRCIEMPTYNKNTSQEKAININMRCIEINLGRPLTARNTRLTLT